MLEGFSDQRVILVLCGSFNPPTAMHLSMFEVATSELRKVQSPSYYKSQRPKHRLSSNLYLCFSNLQSLNLSCHSGLT